MAYASFSGDECLNSDACRVLEEKATGRTAWLKVATISKSDESVSTLNGMPSSIVAKEAFATSSYSELKVSAASPEKGNCFFPRRGRIFLENPEIHRQ
ncbi:hypothetical protein TNCV_4259081 [Trichonephila clavipes]|nr:hypothetical protein TNCV_4259081 [Trichonephila clavipes]